MTTSIQFSDSELLTLSAALRVYHNTAPEFGRQAFTQHEELFPDDVMLGMEQQMVDIANRVNAVLRERYPTPDWEEAMAEMTIDCQRAATLGTHAVSGSKQFRDMSIMVLQTIVGSENN